MAICTYVYTYIRIHIAKISFILVLYFYTQYLLFMCIVLARQIEKIALYSGRLSTKRHTYTVTTYMNPL